ncbi:hypothetical protein [Aliarcobacter butzleri]|uniref:hypothetical protein n=1 Tax=Aliarcobacter butzleri TaxID=28197 RepID=UPI002B2432CE|nr:hypothetical protein [Aliarcobacter butzleri]
MLYISFWIPLTNNIDFEEEFEKNKDKSYSSQISDGLEIKENSLVLKINQNKHLSVDYLGKSYILEYCGSYNFGIISYKLNKNTLEPNFRDLLEVQVYHAFKSFFHIHEYHEDEQDSLLHAKISENNESIDILVEHFSKEYEKKIKMYQKRIELISVETILKSYKTKEYEIHQSLLVISSAQKTILKIKSELIYYNFLIKNFQDSNKYKFYNNIYTRHFTHFDILYKHYEILDNVLDTEYSKIINRYQFYLGFLGIIASIGLGAIGIWYGYNGATQISVDKYYNDYMTQNKSCYDSLYNVRSQSNYILSLEEKNYNYLQKLECK